MKFNNKLFFNWLTILLASFVFISANAQPPRGGRGGDFKRPDIELKGKIVDEQSGAPLEFATIAFYSKRDSSLVGGGITDANGNFMAKSKPGKLYAIADYLGYQKKEINEIPIDFELLKSGQTSFDVGEITMSNAGLNLDEVEIVAEKSETTFSLDKKVFSVGKDLANRGGSAEEILDNVPGVTVDIEGAVSLRGSTGVRILVDGLPSNLGNNLKAIPANTIESVEVISNPSSRYEAQGQAGILNIILKKDKGNGFNGSFDLTGGLPITAGFGANINYRKGKLNWFANYGIRYRESIGGGLSNSIFYYDEIDTFTNNVSERNRTAFTNTIRFGSEYFLNDKTSFTLALRYKISDDNNTNFVNYEDYAGSISPTNLFRTISRQEDEQEDESGKGLNLNFRKQFSNNRKHVLTAAFLYEDDLEVEYSDFYEDTNINGNEQNFAQRGTIDEGTKTYQFQTDYVKPISKDHQYEMGIRASYRNIGNDFLIENKIGDELWEASDDFNNNFNYDEIILAAYGQYGNKFGPFSFQAGLRVEHSDITTELLKTDFYNKDTYTNFFPSLFLNYEIGASNAIQLSYSKRISRPRFFFLNPFITFADRRSLFRGNPILTPEYTDSYELNYLRFWEKATLSAGVFYRHSLDPIRRLRYVQEPPNTTMQPFNFSTRDDIGVEVNLSYSGLKWLRLDANVNAFNLRSPKDSVYVDLVEAYRTLNAVNDYAWTSRVTARFSFWKNSDLQLRYNFRGGSENPQGEGNSIQSLDIGWTKDLLKSKNLTATLSVRDVFNSRRRGGTTIAENFYSYSEFQWRGTTGTLTLSYRINQKKKFNRGRGGMGGGDFDGGGF